MINAHGEPRYIDYGSTLLDPADARVREGIRHVITTMRLLHDVVAPYRGVQFRRMLEAANGERDALAEAFAVSPALDTAVERWPMLRALHARALQGDFEAFVDPDLYAAAAMRLLRMPAGWSTRREVLRGMLGECRRAMAAALHV